MLLLCLGACGASSAVTLEYVVTYEKGASIVHVEAVATGLRGGFADLVFRTEALYVSEHVSNLTSSGGAPEATSEGRWSIRGTGKTLTYSYDIDRVIRWRPNISWGTSTDIAVYFDDTGGILMAPYLFIYPDAQEFASIRVRFDVPSEWQVVVPYSAVGDHYQVQRVTTSLLTDFLSHQNIYMGVMDFYAERAAGDCVVIFGKLAVDDYTGVADQAEATSYAEAAARSVDVLTDVFGQNPYDRFVMYSNFRRHVEGEWEYFRGGRYQGNGHPYWPEHRWDELLGHLPNAWASSWYAPLLTEMTISRGILEMYYGRRLAWDVFGDPMYLANMYRDYLMYEWMYSHHDRELSSYDAGRDEYDVYYRWQFIGLLLDEEIRKRSGGAHTLADAFRWVYETYANSGRRVTAHDLEQAISSATGVWLSDVFRSYVYGNAKLPVYEYLAGFKSHFKECNSVFEEAHIRSDYHGHTVPFFVDIVLAASLARHLPIGLHLGYTSEFADALPDYDSLDALTEDDVIGALSALSGVDCSGFLTYWESSYGRLALDEIIAWLEDYERGQRPSSDSLSAAVVSEEGMAITCDGIPAREWEGIHPARKDPVGDTSEPGGDIESVYVWVDDAFLYGRIDVVGGLAAPERIMYSICIESPEWPQGFQYALQNTSAGPALYVPDEGLRPVAMGINEVFEVAVPLDWIGNPQRIRIYAESRPMGGSWRDRYDDTGWLTLDL
jgi:hypothetical protein